jgi:L-lactate dehydrogenase complex protein LldG
MSSRDAILANIRAARSARNDETARAEVAERLRGHPRNVVPYRSRVDRDSQVRMFVEQISATHATVEAVADAAAVPGAVAAYLAQHNLPAEAVLAPDVGDLAWGSQSLLRTRAGTPVEADQVGVTAAFAAIAESGTLMLTSGEGSPITLNLLPDNHIVVLRRSQITGTLEDAWDALRAKGAMPRTAMFVSGPSSTADIELTLYLGAHGPRRLHVVLIED